MKKIVISMMIMSVVIIGAQQFIKEKNSSKYRVAQPKELFNDLIELEKRIPSFLHKTADLLEGLHAHIEACFEGDKNACTKKKDAQSREAYKQAIVTVNNAINSVELSITRLIDLLKIDNAVIYGKEC